MECPKCGGITRLISGPAESTLVYYCERCDLKIPRLAPWVEAKDLVSKFNRAHIITARMVYDYIELQERKT